MIRVEKVTYYNRDNEEAFFYIDIYFTVFGYDIYRKKYIGGEYTKDTSGVRFEALTDFNKIYPLTKHVK